MRCRQIDWAQLATIATVAVVVVAVVDVVGASSLADQYVEDALQARRAASDAAFGDELSASVTDDQRVDLLRTFNRTNVPKLRAGISALRRRWSQRLQAMPAHHAKTLAANEQKLRPKVRARVKDTGDTLSEVNRRAGLNDLLYQGDVVLTEEQLQTILDAQGSELEGATRQKRQAYRDRFYPSTTWGSTVFYYYDPNATPKIVDAFESAVAFWQANTCINIVQSATAINRIRVFKGQGCYSYVGRIQGVQDLSLGSGCEEFGTAAHELGHAMGFFHTQSRYDRDDYISISFGNIERNFADQFDKESPSTNYNYGMPYDYGSIMQYGATSASINEKPTMVAKDTEYQDTMGSDFVAFYDVSMMNEHYKCKELCPAATSAKCANGGFPSSRNCQVCICPSGYGGTLCDTRPTGCGSQMQATTSWQTFTDQVGDGSIKLQAFHKLCNYWIQAPQGDVVELRIGTLSTVSIDGCIFGGIEIKAKADQKLTGYRYCSPSDNGTVVRSESNLLPVITFNRYLYTISSFSYRSVSSSALPSQTPKPPSPCQDMHPNCMAITWSGFCTDESYSLETRRYYCANSCNLC